MISTAIDNFLETNKDDTVSPSLLWQTLKVVVRGDIIAYTSRVNKARRREQEQLLNSIIDIDHQYSASPTPELYKTKLDLKAKYELLSSDKTERLLLKSRGFVYEHGEKAGRLLAHQLKCPQGNIPKPEVVMGEDPPALEEEEKKKQKRGGRGQIKQKKKTVPQKVTIAKIPRAKKKYVTRVCGLATFDIELKDAQRFFAQKFSCGASVTAEDEIIIQGDFTDIIDVIQEKWPEVDDDSIDDLEEVKT
ncbi:hypothetical protein NHX12_027786 [Muraenolepis orangiensis]|uniref:Density-regulated protein n=1 Tax=Muraenolepis orangiensis TaxID=630683 RepID=A0A9Q0IM76_9TELE|nr:hypothetical protein NHX12_027786 [Muraenolepis orangiensis]